MSRREALSHRSVQRILMNLSEAKIVNLDASIRSLVEPVAAGLLDDPGSLVGLHVLCCNEYVLVTGLTDVPFRDLTEEASRIRADLA